MRRAKHESDLAFVRRIWPLFTWKQCMKCGMDVRREWLWRALSSTVTRHHFSYRNPRELIVCQKCVPTRRGALDYFYANWPPQKPEIAPPPVKPPKIQWPENEVRKEGVM